MASISKQSNGGKTIQFIGGDRKRRSIRLGKVTARVAESIRTRIEAMQSAALARIPIDDETARWLRDIDQGLAEKLARAGLIPARNVVTLAKLLAEYVDGRADVKPATLLVFGHTRRNLLEFFGHDRLLRDITPGDADAWRTWLISTEKLADNTIRRRCSIAKQFFRSAVRRGLIKDNPFADLGGSVRANKSRAYFISAEDAAKITLACPDVEWRLIFALARWGGLRCPSEVYALKWSDIDWAQGRMTVHSPKTEHHQGGESRVVPIFTELVEPLRDGQAAASDPSGYLICKYRKQINLRTRFRKIIKRAGLVPWQKLFQNLRATRETELAASHPIHVVCAWMGHKARIAVEHYLQVTEADFDRATNSGDQALHNAVQTTANKTGPAGTLEGARSIFVPGNSIKSADVPMVPVILMGGEGLDAFDVTDNGTMTSEPWHSRGAAQSGAVNQEMQIYRDLDLVVREWLILPDNIRAMIVDLVSSHRIQEVIE